MVNYDEPWQPVKKLWMLPFHQKQGATREHGCQRPVTEEQRAGSAGILPAQMPALPGSRRPVFDETLRVRRFWFWAFLSSISTMRVWLGAMELSHVRYQPNRKTS